MPGGVCKAAACLDSLAAVASSGTTTAVGVASEEQQERMIKIAERAQKQLIDVYEEIDE